MMNWTGGRPAHSKKITWGSRHSFFVLPCTNFKHGCVGDGCNFARTLHPEPLLTASYKHANDGSSDTNLGGSTELFAFVPQQRGGVENGIQAGRTRHISYGRWDRIDSRAMRVPGGTSVGREVNLGISRPNFHYVINEILIYDVGGTEVRVIYLCALSGGTPDNGDM